MALKKARDNPRLLIIFGIIMYRKTIITHKIRAVHRQTLFPGLTHAFQHLLSGIKTAPFEGRFFFYFSHLLYA